MPIVSHCFVPNVFPAYAGVSLVLSAPDLVSLSLPRLRGGEPRGWASTNSVMMSSPPTRG